MAARADALGEDDTLCMSFVSYAELLKGAESSTRKAKVLQALDQLTRQIPVCYEVEFANWRNGTAPRRPLDFAQ